ncbi:hypothetical protein O6H91_Y464000 [Diphasiastrum complanatum]|nr:hypothetical protein O6H91_Y464000 [Diphasiastrum complanatum]
MASYSAKKGSRDLSYQSKYCHESPPGISSRERLHHSLQQASTTQTLVLGNVSSTHPAPAEKASFDRRSTRVQQGSEACVKPTRLTPLKKQHLASPIGAQKATNTISATSSAKKLFTSSKSSSAKLKDNKLKPTASDLEIAITNISSSPQVLTSECNSSDHPTQSSELEGRSLLDTLPTSEAIGSTTFCQLISQEKNVITQSNKVVPEQTSKFLRKSIGKNNRTDAIEHGPPKSLDKQPSQVKKSSSGIDSQKHNFSKKHSQDPNKSTLISRPELKEQKTSAFSSSSKLSYLSVSNYNDSAACASLQQLSSLTSLGDSSTSWLTSGPSDGLFENTKAENNLEGNLFWANCVNPAAFPFEAHMDVASCKDYEMLMAVQVSSSQTTATVPKFPEEYPDFVVEKNTFLPAKKTLKIPLSAMPATNGEKPISTVCSCPSEDLSTSCVQEPLSLISAHFSPSASTCIPVLKPNPDTLPGRKPDQLSSIGKLCASEQDFTISRPCQRTNSLDKSANAVVNNSSNADNQFFWVEKLIGLNLRNFDEDSSTYLNRVLDKGQQVDSQAEMPAGFVSSSPYISSTGEKTVLRTDCKESQTHNVKSYCFGGAACLDSPRVKQQEVIGENTCNRLEDSMSEINLNLSGNFSVADVAAFFAIAEPFSPALSSDAKFWSPKYPGGLSTEDSVLASAPKLGSSVVLKDKDLVEILDRQHDVKQHSIHDATLLTPEQNLELSRNSEVSLIGHNLQQKHSTSEQQCSIVLPNDQFVSQLERAENTRTVDASFNSFYQSPGNYITHELEENPPALHEDLQQYPTLLENNQFLSGEGLLTQDESCSLSLTNMQNPTKELINYLEGKTCEHSAAENFSDFLGNSQEDEPLFWPMDLKYYWDNGNSEQKVSSIMTDSVGSTDRVSSIIPCPAMTESAQVFSFPLEGENLKAVNSYHAKEKILATEAYALENEGSLTFWETDTKEEQLSESSFGEGLNCIEGPEGYLRQKIPRGEISEGCLQAMQCCESPEHPKYSPSLTSSTDSERTSFVWDSGAKVTPVANAKVWAAETGESEHAQVEAQNRPENKEKTIFRISENDRDTTNVYGTKDGYYDDDEEEECAHVDESSYVSSGDSYDYQKSSSAEEVQSFSSLSVFHHYCGDETQGHPGAKATPSAFKGETIDGETDVCVGSTANNKDSLSTEILIKNDKENTYFGLQSVKHSFRHEWIPVNHHSIEHSFGSAHTGFESRDVANRLNDYGQDSQKVRIDESGQECNCPSESGECEMLAGEPCHELIHNGQLSEFRVKHGIENCQLTKFRHERSWQEKAILTRPSAHGLSIYKNPLWTDGLHPTGRLDLPSHGTIETSSLPITPMEALDLSDQEVIENDIDSYVDFEKGCAWICDQKAILGHNKLATQDTVKGLQRGSQTFYMPQIQLDGETTGTSEVELFARSASAFSADLQDYEKYSLCMTDEDLEMLAGNSCLEKEQFTKTNPSLPSSLHSKPEKEYQLPNSHLKPSEKKILDSKQHSTESNHDRRDQKRTNKVEKQHLDMVHNLHGREEERRWAAHGKMLVGAIDLWDHKHDTPTHHVWEDEHGKMKNSPPNSLKSTDIVAAIAVFTPQFTRDFGSAPIKAVPQTSPHPKSDPLLDEQADFSASEDHQLKNLAPSYQGCAGYSSSAETEAVNTNSDINLSQEGTPSKLVSEGKKSVEYWLDPTMGLNKKNATVFKELCDSEVPNNSNWKMEKAKTAGSKRANEEDQLPGASNIQGMPLKRFCGELSPEANQEWAPFEMEAHTHMKHKLEWSSSGSIQKHGDFQGCSDAMTQIEGSNLENVRSKTDGGVPDQLEPCDATKSKDAIPIILPQGSKLSSLEDPDYCLESPGSMASELVRSFFFTGNRQRNHKQKRNETRKPAELPKETEEHASARRIMVLEEEISKIHAKNKKLESIVKEMEENAKLAAQEKEAWEQQKTAEMENFNSYKSAQIQELKKERRILEKQSRVFAQIPQKWERREIELLKFRLSQVQEEHVQKESRWRLTTNRLRKANQDLTGQIRELQEEIKRYEMRLLAEWDEKETGVETDKYLPDKYYHKSSRNEHEIVAATNTSNVDNVLLSAGGKAEGYGVQSSLKKHSDRSVFETRKSVRSSVALLSTSSKDLEKASLMKTSNASNLDKLSLSAKVMQESCNDKSEQRVYLLEKSLHHRPVLSNKGFTDTKLAGSSVEEAIPILAAPQRRTGRDYGIKVSDLEEESALITQKRQDADTPTAPSTPSVCDRGKLIGEKLLIEAGNQQQHIHRLHKNSSSSDTSQIYGVTQNTGTHLCHQQQFISFDTKNPATCPEADVSIHLTRINSAMDGDCDNVQDSSSHSIQLLSKAFPKKLQPDMLSKRLREGRLHARHFSDESILCQGDDALNWDSSHRLFRDTPSHGCQVDEVKDFDELVRGSSVTRLGAVVFSDGTRKEVYENGLESIYFANGDINNSYADGTIEYFYAEVNIWHTTNPDGIELFHFSNNQVGEFKKNIQ